MKIRILPAPLAAVLIAGLSTLPETRADLPSLEQQPWIGYFAAFANKRFNIGVTPQVSIELCPMNPRGEPVAKILAIGIVAGIEEILPDGKVILKQIKVDTLQSDEAATAKLEKTTIRGKVTGDAEFELNLEQNRDIIFIGGRVLNAGTLTQNPIRFAVRVNIPRAYPFMENKPGDPPADGGKQDRETQKAEKAFLKMVKKDSLDVKWTDGKRVRQDYEKSVDATSKELNGPGIMSAEIDTGSYKNRRLVFTASPNSAMTLWNAQPRPLHEGFKIIWTADSAKDPEGKARLAIQVR